MRMLKIKYLSILFLFMLFSCTDNNIDQDLWEKAQNYYKLDKYSDCMITLSKIIHDYPNSDKIIDAKYLIAELYLNEYKEYEESITYLDDIIEKHPNNQLSKKALFTSAYIYGNYLESYSDSYNRYSSFIEKYPNDELSESAKYEMNNLQPHMDVINSIITD